VHEVSDSATDAVRHIYAAVQASIRSGALRRVDTTFQCDSESLEYEAHWYADSTGMIRRLDLGVGTGDHAEQLAFYYDSKQRLRFAYAQRGAVVGTQQKSAFTTMAVARNSRVVSAGCTARTIRLRRSNQSGIRRLGEKPRATDA